MIMRIVKMALVVVVTMVTVQAVEVLTVAFTTIDCMVRWMLMNNTMTTTKVLAVTMMNGVPHVMILIMVNNHDDCQ
jgi:hypothetical protein